MKQKLIILLILSLALIGSAVADVPPTPIELASDTSQSGHVIWSWSVGGSTPITDSYNVSVDSIWHNTTISTSYDDNVGTGATSTIIVLAYNNTGAGNLSASITGLKRSVIQFNGVTDTIESTIPVFGALSELIVAVVPYLLTLIVVTGIITLIGFLFKRERVFR